MSIIGYARVSSTGQSLDVQIDKLNQYGCNKTYQDKISGTTADRPELKQCLDYVREGDQLVITKLDRLARSTLHLTQIADMLQQKGVELVVIDQHIDTSTPTGKLLFNMLASIAEFETEIRKERQLEGIAKAKSRGTRMGARPKLSDSQINQLQDDRVNGMTIPELTRKYNVSKATVYRLLPSQPQY